MEGFMEVELMATKSINDDRQRQDECKTICLKKVGKVEFCKNRQIFENKENKKYGCGLNLENVTLPQNVVKVCCNCKIERN